jgi:hypothetical protein
MSTTPALPGAPVAARGSHTIPQVDVDLFSGEAIGGPYSALGSAIALFRPVALLRARVAQPSARISC